MNELSVDKLVDVLWTNGYDSGPYLLGNDGLCYLEIRVSEFNIFVGPVWGTEDSDPIIDPDDLKIFETQDSSWSIPDEVKDCEELVAYISERY